MQWTRRGVIGSALAAAAVRPVAVSAQRRPSGTIRIWDQVRAFAEADLAKGFPGMTIALIGPDGGGSTIAMGMADMARQRPVRPEHLFQIGSITKSLTAMAAFVLMERGRLDGQARIDTLLPGYPLPPEPITVAQLIEHSSGLPNALSETAFLDVPGGRLWTGFRPGSKFSYCNLGYLLLGDIVARASGMSFPRALKTLVLDPLGMTRSRAAIVGSDRDLYAAGHIRRHEELPWMPGAPLDAAPWTDFFNAAGCVGAPAGDMIRYLQFIAALGRGKGAPLFSDATAARFAAATIDDTIPGVRYGNGLMHMKADDVPVLRHTGGMIGFSSAFTVDAAAGVGCFASVNVGGIGGYRPTEITEYAVALLRASYAGTPTPAVRQPRAAVRPVSNPARFTGEWRGPDGLSLEVVAQGTGLAVGSGGSEHALRQVDDAIFLTDHPALAPQSLDFSEPTNGLWLGGRLLGKGRVPDQPPVPAPLQALVGAYYEAGTWNPRQNVYARGDTLFLADAAIRQASDGSWRFTDEELASERVWFEHVSGGKAQVLNLSGQHYSRQPDA